MASALESGLVAGGDPLALSMADNPYVRLRALTPDDDVKAIIVLQQDLQRQGLDPLADAAFRTLRDAAARATWDLFTLGTTPGIPSAIWSETRALLAAGDRAGARACWLGGGIEPSSVEGLHVRGILVANELAACPREDTAGIARALGGFVGCWCALLAKPDWLRRFARSRCSTWSRTGTQVGLDLADDASLPERVERMAFGFVEKATEHDEDPARCWRQEWERERVAIEMLTKASRAGAPLPGGAPHGLGPRALEDLGSLEGFASALGKLAAEAKGGLYVSEVRDGVVSLDPLSAEKTAAAAWALRVAFSPELGPSAASLWVGDSREAEARLDGRPNRIDRSHWWPTLEEQTTVEADLRLEIGLQRFREDLADNTVPMHAVLETASRLIASANRVGCGERMREAVEKKVVGRTVACIEANGVPKPGEMRRVVSIATGALDLLKKSGGGDIAAQAVAQLRLRRAADVWGRSKSQPKEKDRFRVLEDLFQAAELAPHNPEIAQSLAVVVCQLQGQVNVAEGKALLQRASRVLETCEGQTHGHPGLREAREHLTEFLDPDKAIRKAWEDIDVLLPKLKSPPGGGTR